MAAATTKATSKATNETTGRDGELIAGTRYLGASLMIFEVPSRSRPGEVYRVLGDRRNGRAFCHCAGYRHRGRCAHARAAAFWMAARAETQAAKDARQAEREERSAAGRQVSQTVSQDARETALPAWHVSNKPFSIWKS